MFDSVGGVGGVRSFEVLERNQVIDDRLGKLRIPHLVDLHSDREKFGSPIVLLVKLCGR